MAITTPDVLKRIAKLLEEEFEEIHECRECNRKFAGIFEPDQYHLVVWDVVGNGAGQRRWTVALGCEGYLQLGRAREKTTYTV